MRLTRTLLWLSPKLKGAPWAATTSQFLAHLPSMERFVVDGPSMEPALRPWDYILASRIAHLERTRNRGDIIVLHDPLHPERHMIKRVVGLPGETVRVEPALIFVGGNPLKEPYLKSHAWRHFEPATEWSIAEGEYFLLGDNRDYSRDSRVFGPVRRELIVGKAWLRYWPPERWGVVKHGEFGARSSGVDTSSSPVLS